MNLRFGVAAVALVCAAATAAQSPGNQQPTVIMAPVGSVQARRGVSTTVDLAFRVGSGFHINSNKPHSDFLIPTELKLNGTERVTVAGIKYPAGTDQTFPFSPNEKLSVYSGDFSISVSLKPSARAAAGTYPVKGELTYQACDKAACYPPKTMPVSFQVTVPGS